MTSKRSSSVLAATAAIGYTATMLIDGKPTEVGVPGGLEPAHGKGLDGRTRVESLKVGESPFGPGKFLMADSQGTAIEGTADEFFAAAKRIAAAAGYDLVSKKRT